MSTQLIIEKKLGESLSPLHLDVSNESHKHNVPANSETHFKVIVVSNEFDGQSLVNRHRTVNRLLAEQLQTGVHALSLHTLTESEWEARNNVVQDSPDCKGGDGTAGNKRSSPDI